MQGSFTPYTTTGLPTSRALNRGPTVEMLLGSIAVLGPWAERPETRAGAVRLLRGMHTACVLLLTEAGRIAEAQQHLRREAALGGGG